MPLTFPLLNINLSIIVDAWVAVTNAFNISMALTCEKKTPNHYSMDIVCDLCFGPGILYSHYFIFFAQFTCFHHVCTPMLLPNWFTMYPPTTSTFLVILFHQMVLKDCWCKIQYHSYAITKANLLLSWPLGEASNFSCSQSFLRNFLYCGLSDGAQLLVTAM